MKALPNIVDLLGLRDIVTAILLDDPRLVDINVVPETDKFMSSDLDIDALWLSPKKTSGLSGVGGLVEMPTGDTESPNVSGPPLTFEVRVVFFEERNVNLAPGVGTEVTAEQWGQVALDILHLQHVGGFGTLRAAKNSLEPARDWMALKPGVFAFRTTLQVTCGRTQTRRTKCVSLTAIDYMTTLSCADEAAEIFYTLDGTPPVRANEQANRYVGPFEVSAGQILQASARLENCLLSEILKQHVT